jgi:hypothetical protein
MDPTTDSTPRTLGGAPTDPITQRHERRIELIVGDGVPEFVAARGGRLYAWTETHACCTGGLTLLETATAPPARHSFAAAPLVTAGFEVYLDAGRRRPPRTLTLELSRRGRRVRAFWDDCAYVD